MMKLPIPTALEKFLDSLRRARFQMKHWFPAIVLGLAWSEAFSAPPNVVLFMVDDLGWNHLGVSSVSQNSHAAYYRTPELEKLAQEGLSFTHAYAQPNCAPTRAAMLTGQYPARLHNGVYVVRSLDRAPSGTDTLFLTPEQHEDVAPAAITLAEALKHHGYTTAHIGKYHVGGHEGGESTLPQNSGFDLNLGGSQQGHQGSCFAKFSPKTKSWYFPKVGDGAFDIYAAPYTASYLEKQGFPDSLEGSPKHLSDALGDALTETIGKLDAEQKPFFLQFHTYAVHGPVKARPDLYREAFSRIEDHPDRRKMAHYLGFIAGLDTNLARLRRALDDPNGDGDCSDSIRSNTLILFTSDNGGTHASNAPLKGRKGMLSEGGIRVPL
ncbi:MAG: sulfatase-like hydrolase/transferase, partial [Verrucomicrobiales bacterium]